MSEKNARLALKMAAKVKAANVNDFPTVDLAETYYRWLESKSNHDKQESSIL